MARHVEYDNIIRIDETDPDLRSLCIDDDILLDDAQSFFERHPKLEHIEANIYVGDRCNFIMPPNIITSGRLTLCGNEGKWDLRNLADIEVRCPEEQTYIRVTKHTAGILRAKTIEADYAENFECDLYIGADTDRGYYEQHHE